MAADEGRKFFTRGIQRTDRTTLGALTPLSTDQEVPPSKEEEKLVECDALSPQDCKSGSSSSNPGSKTGQAT